MLYSPCGEGLAVNAMHSHYGSTFDNAIVDRLGVTELPRLTSDSILTADRRGGILISFGPNRTPAGAYNPFEVERSWPPIPGGRVQPYPNGPMYISPTD